MSAECWEWRGLRDKHGYGRKGPYKTTHRLAWEWANGPVPAGMCVLHRCDNPPCCNPDHLFLGTQADNLADMVAKGRHHNQKKETCVRGHSLQDEANVYMHNGHRSCRRCGAQRSREYKAKKETRT